MANKAVNTANIFDSAPKASTVETVSAPTTDKDKLIAELQAALAAEKSKPKAAQLGITAKVTEKGGISLYGFQKWPVTLYRDQLNRLMKVCTGEEKLSPAGHQDVKLTLREFIDAADSKGLLSVKKS